MIRQKGRSTLIFEKEPRIIGYASVVGTKEGKGPLANKFDEIASDDYMNKNTWEEAESELQTRAVSIALEKAKISKEQVNFIFAGDLLNQCIGSSFGLRELNIPFAGLYGACSTMALSIAMASVFTASKAAEYAAAVTSSHFCSAERQYRFPLEYGGQRTPTAQWTVTGSGSVILSAKKELDKPYVQAAKIGAINDLGVTDANNMGAAMAPAAADTICGFFEDTSTNPSDYDGIFTGDLGCVGSELLYQLANQMGYDLRGYHTDCGMMIYDLKNQDVHAGGSGCGCGASVLCSDILSRISSGELRNVLFIATGALMSPTSTQQGNSIPTIAHLINIKR